MMVKAQFSLEFITGVSVMLIVYVLAIGAYSYYTENNIIEDSFSEHICYNIANAIDAAVIGRDGFSLNISVPYRVYIKELTGVKITNNFTLTVGWEDEISACSLVTNDITNITVYGGKSSATNIGGKIYVTSMYTNTTEASVGETVKINASYVKGSRAVVIIKNETDTITSLPVSWYQENANQSSTTGTWTGAANTIDGDFNTPGYVTICGVGVTCYKYGNLSVNYSKPDGAEREDSIWKTKTVYGTVLQTIPSSCWNQAVLQFRIVSDHRVACSGFCVSYFDVNRYCWNGSNWQSLDTGMKPPVSNNTVFEEAMDWEGGDFATISNNAITYDWNTIGLTPGIYIINVIDEDYPKLFAEREVILK